MKYIYRTKHGLVVQVPGLDGKVRTRRVKTFAEGKRVRGALLRGLKVVATKTHTLRLDQRHKKLQHAVIREALAWYRRVKVAYGKPMAVVDCRAFEAACAALEKFETEDTK